MEVPLMTVQEVEICQELSALYKLQLPFVEAENYKTTSFDQLGEWNERRERIQHLENHLLEIIKATSK
jgi:hypothetical protein